MPVCFHMNSHKEVMKRGPGRLKTFLYKHRDGIHMERDKVEYRVSSESVGTRVIYYRNLRRLLRKAPATVPASRKRCLAILRRDLRKV